MTLDKLIKDLGECDLYGIGNDDVLSGESKDIVRALELALEYIEENYDLDPECKDINEFHCEIWACNNIKIDQVCPDGEWIIEKMWDGMNYYFDCDEFIGENLSDEDVKELSKEIVAI